MVTLGRCVADTNPRTTHVQVTEFEATNLVFFEGVQAAAIVVCDSASGDVEPVTVDLWVSFHNPYGFVPGAKYGLIPAYGVLSVIYGV